MSVGLNLFYDNLRRFCVLYLILCLQIGMEEMWDLLLPKQLD